MHYLDQKYNLENQDYLSIIDDLPFWSAPFGMKLMDIVHYRKNIHALDIGFGLGFPLVELAMRLGPTSTIIGIDPWKQGHERVRLKIKLTGVQNVRLVEGVAETMPFGNDTFDLIFSNNGINNVQDLTKSLHECYRVAKVGAQFVFTFNLNQTFVQFYSPLRESLRELGLGELEPKIDRHIYSKRKPLLEMKSEVERVGFIVNTVYKDNFDYRFADGTSMLNHFSIKLSFLPSWKEIVPTERRNEIFQKVEEKMNLQSAEKGGFTMSVPFATFDCKKTQ